MDEQDPLLDEKKQRIFFLLQAVPEEPLLMRKRELEGLVNKKAERQLLKYVRIAGKAKGSTGQVLLQLLEMPLDNILFRLGMTATIPQSYFVPIHFCCNKKRGSVPPAKIRNRRSMRDNEVCTRVVLSVNVTN